MKDWYHLQTGEINYFDFLPLQKRAGEIMDNIEGVMQTYFDGSENPDRKLYDNLREAYDQQNFVDKFPQALDDLIFWLKAEQVETILKRRESN